MQCVLFARVLPSLLPLLGLGGGLRKGDSRDVVYGVGVLCVLSVGAECNSWDGDKLLIVRNVFCVWFCTVPEH